MLQGRIDEATRHHLAGWAFDPDAPGPVSLLVTVDDNLAARVPAADLRNDLVVASIGDGRHGFSVPLVALAAQSHTVRVFHEHTGEDIPGSPLVLPRAGEPGQQSATPMQGRIDQASRGLVRGWVRDPDAPASPVSLLVSVDGVLAARVLANGHRPDLEEAGFGVGRHAFVTHLSGLSPLRRYVVRVQREGNGLDIPGSPVILAPIDRLDQASRDTLAVLLAEPVGPADLDERIQFLVGQTERLLQLRAERHAQRAEREHLRQLRRRWRPRSDSQAPTPGVATPLLRRVDVAGPPEPLRRALVIDDTTPVLDRDAGSRAIVSHMRSLQRLGHAVAFMPADTQGGPGAAVLEALGIQACHAPWYVSVEELLRREAGGVDLVYLHRVSNARYLPLIRHHLPRARLVFAVADLHHLRLARQAEAEREPDLLDYSRHVRATEIAAARIADAVVTHSTSEAALLRPELPANRVHVVPWSVPARPTAVPFADRRGLAFIGGYRHAPNVDAAHHLAQVIMPLVWAMDPTVECRLVGSDMPDTLRALAGDRIVVDGHVPDLAAVFDRVRLTVAPLSFGAGVKGKVLDSLAAGVPCACTPVAAEGIALPDVLAGLVASDARDLAAIIHRLHADPGHNRACSQAGLDYAATVLSEDALDVLMRRVAALPARAAPAPP